MYENDELDTFITCSVKEAAHEDAQDSPCPDAGLLAAYIDGSLDDTDRTELETHLCNCRDCLGLVISAREAFNPGGMEKADAALVTRHLSRVTARKRNLLDVVVSLAHEAVEIIGCTGTVLLEPAPAFMTRGTAPAPKKLVSIRKRFDGLTLDLDVERTGGTEVDLMVTARRPDGLTSYPGLRASLFQGDRERISMMLEDGRATFESLRQASYNIKVLENGCLLGEVDIRIEGGRK